jgi:hypothetical protein
VMKYAPVFLQQNTVVQIWISGNLRCQRASNMNRIGGRTIMCMLLIAVLAINWNAIGHWLSLGMSVG